MNNRYRNLVIPACLVTGLLGCDGGENGAVSNEISFSTADVVTLGSIQSLELPGGSVQSLPAEVVAQDTKKVELGRLLFWDPILSGEQDVACVSCHLPERGYSDDLELSIGVGDVGQGQQRTLGYVGFSERNA